LLRVRSPIAREVAAKMMTMNATIDVDRAISDPETFERVARWSGSSATREELEPTRLAGLAELRSGHVYF
jgi:hypothetical protein